MKCDLAHTHTYTHAWGQNRQIFLLIKTKVYKNMENRVIVRTLVENWNRSGGRRSLDGYCRIRGLLSIRSGSTGAGVSAGKDGGGWGSFDTCDSEGSLLTASILLPSSQLEGSSGSVGGVRPSVE